MRTRPGEALCDISIGREATTYVGLPTLLRLMRLGGLESGVPALYIYIPSIWSELALHSKRPRRI